MALLSLTMKRHSDFLDVPPSPPQSPPVIDAESSTSSPAAADSPLDNFVDAPPSFHAAGPADRPLKKRRKQERPSPFVLERADAASVDAADLDNEARQSTHHAVERPSEFEYTTAWNGAENGQTTFDAAAKPADRPLDHIPSSDFERSEFQTAVVRPIPSEPTLALSNPTSESSNFFQALPAAVVMPSSPALARVGSAPTPAAGSDGEGDPGDGGVPETCPECRKVFKRRVYLQRHMAREHWSTAKVFKCDKCAYETKHQSNLLVHRRTHTGERPYHCGACGQRYTQGHLLKAHIRSRHGSEMAYYNMDKRSDSVRCRRTLSTAVSRMEQPGTPSVKEDKIRFLLEAAEAARGGGAGAPRGAAPAGPFAGISLGQYVSALSSCLPGASAAAIRPLMWPPPSLPHDGVTSHAALLSSLAAAPVPAVRNDGSSTSVPDRSLLTSLLASYATGAPLFSVDGMSALTGGVETAKSLPKHCAAPEVSSVPQDLSLSAGRGWPAAAEQDAKRPYENGFLPGQLFTTATPPVCATTVSVQARSSPVVKTGSETPMKRVVHPLKQQPEFASQFPGGLQVGAVVKMEEEEATDLSMRSGADRERTSPGANGTVDLSSRSVEAIPNGIAVPTIQSHQSPALLSRRLPKTEFEEAFKTCCEGESDGPCPHLHKLKQLRRNVYRMLSVFTPYLDVAGAGIVDAEADSVDEFLHEVIYSSKLDASAD